MHYHWKSLFSSGAVRLLLFDSISSGAINRHAYLLICILIALSSQYQSTSLSRSHLSTPSNEAESIEIDFRTISIDLSKNSKNKKFQFKISIYLEKVFNDIIILGRFWEKWRLKNRKKLLNNFKYNFRFERSVWYDRWMIIREEVSKKKKKGKRERKNERIRMLDEATSYEAHSPQPLL